jgi:hypothetical protein
MLLGQMHTHLMYKSQAIDMGLSVDRWYAVVIVDFNICGQLSFARRDKED